ncbi:hypothetical protein SOASR032_05150 [Pragia fontium]|uniref:Uncharacterized protein n=1 Tax=Pragia fontium TaxID=82985 RepID=A0ABQ5LG65_9GAMM|nr:hypothetical protein SOASR032_05150 [Pragia fontium]
MNTKCKVCDSVYFELKISTEMNGFGHIIYTIQCTRCGFIMATINKTRIVEGIAKTVGINLSDESML